MDWFSISCCFLLVSSKKKLNTIARLVSDANRNFFNLRRERKSMKEFNRQASAAVNLSFSWRILSPQIMGLKMGKEDIIFNHYPVDRCVRTLIRSELESRSRRFQPSGDSRARAKRRKGTTVYNLERKKIVTVVPVSSLGVYHSLKEETTHEAIARSLPFLF